MNGTILALHRRVDAVWRTQRAGLAHFASLRGWRLESVCMRDGCDLRRLREAVGRSMPLGIVTSLSEPLPAEATDGLPVVYFDCPIDIVPRKAPHFRHDARMTSHLAASELFKTGFKTFSYLPATVESYWSREREEEFAREVRERGGKTAPACRIPVGAALSAMRRAVRAWVEALPKPCGVLAANDESASLLMEACRAAGVAVPKEIAVVGVDNDLSKCLACEPTLTSVVPDWWGGAFLAAEALDKMMRGKKVDARQTFRPLGLVSRGSTVSASPRKDFRVELAMTLIRGKACLGLRASDVVGKMGCSRRLAEERFREITGQSILEAIRQVRFRSASLMLVRTNFPVAEVAKRCGWKSVPTFCIDFKREKGMTPADWRCKG